jgi:hypothetical protein
MKIINISLLRKHFNTTQFLVEFTSKLWHVLWMLISVDPGLHHCGVAMWEGGKLAKAVLVRGDPTPRIGAGAASPMANAIVSTFPPPWDLVIELPQVYAVHRGVDPNDLIALATVVGAVMSRAVNVTYHLPAQWKGQTPKRITTSRARTSLSVEELLHIEECAPYLMHNVWDAVALGLYHLKQTKGRK